MSRENVLLDSLRRSEAEFRSIYDEIKSASPLWRDLITSRGQPVGLAAMQQLVPARGYMLFYHVGYDQSFLFLIPRTGPAHAVPLHIAKADARRLGVSAGPVTASALESLLGGDGADSSGATITSFLARGEESAARTTALAQSRLYALWHVLVPDSTCDGSGPPMKSSSCPVEA